jgi:hypothetical protein
MVAGCISGVGATVDNGADDVEGSVTVDCVGGNIPSSGTSLEPGEFGEMQNSSSKTSNIRSVGDDLESADGLKKSRVIFIFRPKIISAGDFPSGAEGQGVER